MFFFIKNQELHYEIEICCLLTWLLEVFSVQDVIEEDLVSSDPRPDRGVVRGWGLIQSLQTTNQKLAL